MGALPSRETQARALYSHRHGRNRRAEIVLIPLTKDYFPSADCALFQHVFQARQRRTGKYYYRALRSTKADPESDFFCATSSWACTTAGDTPAEGEGGKKEEEKEKDKEKSVAAEAKPAKPAKAAAAGDDKSDDGGSGSAEDDSDPMDSPGLDWETFDRLLVEGRAREAQRREERKQRRQQRRAKAAQAPPTAAAAEGDQAEGPADTDGKEAQEDKQDKEEDKEKQEGEENKEEGKKEEEDRSDDDDDDDDDDEDDELAGQRPGDYDYESYTDTAEGLYRVLVLDNEACMYDTDEELREAYWQQVRHEQEARCGGALNGNLSNTSAEESVFDGWDRLDTIDRLSYGDFVSGYVAASAYYKGKRRHMHTAPPRGTAGAQPVPPQHLESPAAAYIRPIPCVIASRFDPIKTPQPTNDPLYTRFANSYVKVMGMFGLFPCSIPLRHSSAPGPPVRKEGFGNADADVDCALRTEQHMLKGTMFVDKDVGDQILGNMLMLAAHQYVRQCIGCGIDAKYLPSLPLLCRFPISNIPMLQFLRECRVRLRTLLEAGTCKSGERPFHVGLGGAHPEDASNMHAAEDAFLRARHMSHGGAPPPVMTTDEADLRRLLELPVDTPQRLQEEGYVWESDVPGVGTRAELFRDYTAQARARMEAEEKLPRPPPAPAPIATGRPNAPQTNAVLSSAHPPQCYVPLHRHAGMNTNTGGSIPILMVSGFNVQHTPLSHPALLETDAVRPVLSDEAAVTAYQRRTALRRRQRFRLWVEDGHLVFYASAAYVRRGAILLAQQLNTTVDSTAVPAQRGWHYRGVLEPGQRVPAPEYRDDVVVMGAEAPGLGLWQGDVLRCCTEHERRLRAEGKPLPVPWLLIAASVPDAETVAAAESMAALRHDSNNPDMPPSITPPVHPFDAHDHSPALPGSFWVLASGGFDDTFLNISEPVTPIPTKQERHERLQQIAAEARRLAKAAAKKKSKAEKNAEEKNDDTASNKSSGSAATGTTTTTAAAATTPTKPSFHAHYFPRPRPDAPCPHTNNIMKANLPPSCRVIDRREGTLNIEEVILCWIKAICAQSREVGRDDPRWVRDPMGRLVRTDRYLVWRYEESGVRYFIGAAPKFLSRRQADDGSSVVPGAAANKNVNSAPVAKVKPKATKKKNADTADAAKNDKSTNGNNAKNNNNNNNNNKQNERFPDTIPLQPARTHRVHSDDSEDDDEDDAGDDRRWTFVLRTSAGDESVGSSNDDEEHINSNNNNENNIHSHRHNNGSHNNNSSASSYTNDTSSNSSSSNSSRSHSRSNSEDDEDDSAGHRPSRRRTRGGGGSGGGGDLFAMDNFPRPVAASSSLTTAVAAAGGDGVMLPVLAPQSASASHTQIGGGESPAPPFPNYALWMEQDMDRQGGFEE